MVKEFSTFGSCASRGIFNTKINEDYKNYFHINYSVESSSLISLMSKPVTGKEELIDSNNNYYNTCVTDDITKSFKNFLKLDKLDYLILDTYFDATCPVIKLNKNKFVTKTLSLKNTTYYNELLEYPEIDIINNFDEYMKFYEKYSKLFFKFLKRNCTDLKVILNGSRSVYKHSVNGEIIENSNFKNLSFWNDYRDYLDDFILKNFDVEFLPFNSNTLYDADYLFGVHHTHYEQKYFLEKTKQLNEIIYRNDLIPYDDQINVDFRRNLRKNVILKRDYSKLSKIFSKYYLARIDIKNEGAQDNIVEIIDNSDKESVVLNPDWFKNELGNGIQIQSKKGEIKLKIKCINDGNLKINLRGIDSRNEKDKRIPIYVNFTEFNVNKEDIILETVSACHDFPIVYEKEVQDSEILDIIVKWIPF